MALDPMVQETLDTVLRHVKSMAAQLNGIALALERLREVSKKAA